MQIGIVGPGAVGGLLAAMLTRSGCDVTIVSTRRSAELIRNRGIQVTGPGDQRFTTHPTTVVAGGESARPVDVLAFCVKSYDTETAMRDAQNLCDDTTTVLCLQNGVKNEKILADAFGAHRLLSGVMYVGAERETPGRIRCDTSPRIIVGAYTEHPDPSVLGALEQAFTHAGISCEQDVHIWRLKWRKFLFNCGLNPLTALARQRLASILAHPAGRELFDALVEEAFAAALASGAPIDEDDRRAVDRTAAEMDISSSMAADVEAGRRTELDAFSGHVLDLAAQHGIETPATRTVHALVQLLDHRASS